MHELKLNDKHFEGLADSCEALYKHIFRVEREEALDDVSLENLKKRKITFKRRALCHNF